MCLPTTTVVEWLTSKAKINGFWSKQCKFAKLHGFFFLDFIALCNVQYVLPTTNATFLESLDIASHQEYDSKVQLQPKCSRYFIF